MQTEQYDLNFCVPVDWSTRKFMAIVVFQDWSMQTSKGCFFYEDDEIVTHVYNLNLREESSVYFTAYPIQEPASCMYRNKEHTLDKTFE